MARRRLTPAQPGYFPAADTAPRKEARAAPIAQVSGQSAEAAALREVTQGLQAAREEGRMVLEVPLTEIAPGYLLRDRVQIDSEALAALKASIAAHGQRTPAELTPWDGERLARETARPASGAEGAGDAGAYRYGLISGWRRLQARSELHDETGEARFATLRALLRPAGDAAESYVAMVEENEIRVGLSYYERARLVAELARSGVFEDHSAALRTLFATASRAKRSKIGSFVTVVEALEGQLQYPIEIGERLGLELARALDQGAKPAVLAVLGSDFSDAQAEQAALRQALETWRQSGRSDRPEPPKAAPRPPAPGAGDGAGADPAPCPWLPWPGIALEARAGHVALTGEGVTPAFIEALEAWLAGQGG